MPGNGMSAKAALAATAQLLLLVIVLTALASGRKCAQVQTEIVSPGTAMPAAQMGNARPLVIRQALAVKVLPATAISLANFYKLKKGTNHD